VGGKFLLFGRTLCWLVFALRWSWQDIPILTLRVTDKFEQIRVYSIQVFSTSKSKEKKWW
jgi:hypothetical protein